MPVLPCSGNGASGCLVAIAFSPAMWTSSFRGRPLLKTVSTSVTARFTFFNVLHPAGEKPGPLTAFSPTVDEIRCLLSSPLPRCPQCGGLARPNVMMFGDGGWVETRAQRQSMRLEMWLGSVQRPLVIELGAGTAIPTVRHFSHRSSTNLAAGLSELTRGNFPCRPRLMSV